MSGFIYVDEAEVSSLLQWDATFAATEAALVSVVTGRAIQTPRTATKILDSDSLLLTMPGCLKHDIFGALGCKLITLFPDNAKLTTPLPVINATITLFDDTTGELKAVIAGTEITKWRTAAASAVATKHLTAAKNPPRILAVLGAGTQGRIHAIALHHFFKFKEVRVWNRNFARAESLATELNQNVENGVFKAVRSNEESVKGADVVVTATFAAEPIVQRDWLKPGVHINAVGAGLNHHSELSESIYLSSDVFIDYTEGANKELAGLQTLGVKFKAEIGAVVTGAVAPPTPDRVTVFASLGMAVEDCAMARMIYDAYRKRKENCK